MIRPYETTVVFDGSLGDDVLAKERENVEKILSENGEVQRTEVWGKRKLAYPIRKKVSGYYCLFFHKAEGDVNGRLKAALRLNQHVLRYLTVVAEKEAAPEKSGQESTEQAAAEASGEPGGAAGDNDTGTERSEKIDEQEKPAEKQEDADNA